MKLLLPLIIFLIANAARSQSNPDMLSILSLDEKLQDHSNLIYRGQDALACFYIEAFPYRSISKSAEDSSSNIPFYDTSGNLVIGDSIVLTIKEYQYLLNELSMSDTSNWLINYYPNARLINDEILSMAFSESLEKGWDYVHNHYGEYIYTFLKPIFFRNNSLWLFYTATRSGSISGHGGFSVYIKVKSKWEYYGCFRCWIS